MHQSVYQSSSKLDKAMNPEQFNQVVEAILAGKYSWACVLILRFAGYNPLHYIPYRTYNRLIKEHRSSQPLQRQDKDSQLKTNRSNTLKPTTIGRSSKMSDLNHLEVVSEKRAKIRGGNSALASYFDWYTLAEF